MKTHFEIIISSKNSLHVSRFFSGLIINHAVHGNNGLNLIGMDLTKYICTFNRGYKSRNYDENDFHLIIKHNQDYFRKSYFIRSAKLWNSLPPVIKTSNTLTSFRTRVINLYNSKLITYNLPSISY